MHNLVTSPLIHDIIEATSPKNQEVEQGISLIGFPQIWGFSIKLQSPFNSSSIKTLEPHFNLLGQKKT
jgi:hypothetical protein